MRILIVIVTLSLFTMSCGDDTPPAAAAPAAGGAKPSAAAAPAAAAGVGRSADGGVSDLPVYQYSYNPINKRDPFRGRDEDRGPRNSPEPDTGPEPITCDEPLCRVELDEVALVAIVSGDSNPIAMVEDRTGVGFKIQRNSKLGRQGGKVTQILRDCIVVTSFVRGPDGKAQPNRQNICIKKPSRMQPVLDLLTGKMRE